MTMQCHAGYKLSKVQMEDPETRYNKAARRFGFARIALSSPNGSWMKDRPEDYLTCKLKS